MSTHEAGAGHGHGQGPDVVLDEAFWEEMYRSRSTIWSGRPNSQLVTEVGDLVPGTALDVGSGEGADAVWLAELGWQVTAVDISATALMMGESTAVQAGPGVSGRIPGAMPTSSADRIRSRRPTIS